MKAGLGYAIRFVADMERAVRFHVDVLGMQLRFQSPEWSEFDTGSTTLALHMASDQHPAGDCQLGFFVPDLPAFHAKAIARGVHFTSAPTLLHGQSIARFLDADGAECSVSGARPESGI